MESRLARFTTLPFTPNASSSANVALDPQKVTVTDDAACLRGEPLADRQIEPKHDDAVGERVELTDSIIGRVTSA